MLAYSSMTKSMASNAYDTIKTNGQSMASNTYDSLKTPGRFMIGGVSCPTSP
jgi:hypothetical protein